jgi:hypothetical protein
LSKSGAAAQNEGMAPLNKPCAILCAALLVCVLGPHALGRQDGAQPQDEVVKIDSALVQTGVNVFDKQGRFVEGLKREDFELRVDGRLVPISFFESASLREIAASQEALSALAADTGGRALRNQNTFDRFIEDALAETSRHHLNAWRPEPDAGKDEKLRKIQISVVGRPELTVRSSRGFVGDGATATAERAGAEAKGAAKREKTPDADLRQALADAHPRQALPLQLSLIYLDTPASGTVLTTSVQAPAGLLSYGAQDREPAQLTVAGVVLDDQGKPAASFRNTLNVNPPSGGDRARDASKVIYNNPSPLKPASIRCESRRATNAAARSAAPCSGS